MDIASYLNGVINRLMERVNTYEAQVSALEKLSGYEITDLTRKFAAGYTLIPPDDIK